MGRLGVQTAICLLLATGLAPGRAAANGRPPSTTDVEFQPGDDQLIVLPTTFGLLLSRDKGASFHWICEDAVGYGGTYDPDYSVSEEGAIYATTFNGLRVSRDGGCTFEETQFYNDLSGGSSPVLLEGLWVGEVEVASDGKVWATTSTGGQSNDIYLSTDGATFESANALRAGAWWKSLRVSKSNPDIVYASGYVIEVVNESPAEALLYKSEDGGQNWSDLRVADFAFGTQPNLLIEGISPTNPDILFARVAGARDPEGDDLYRSSDGGVSWTKVLEMGGTISAFVIRADDSVLVGTATPCLEELSEAPDAALANKGCFRRSASGELGSWETPAVEPRLGCLGERSSDSALFACASNGDPDNFALGLSMDEGDSWTPILRLIDNAGPLECPEATEQYSCAQRWPILCATLEVCEEPDAGIDVDPDTGGSEGGCLGCQTGGNRSIPSLLVLLAALGLALRRRS